MHIYLTDDSDRKFFRTYVSAACAQGERNNLARHLGEVKAGNPTYAKIGIDPKSARLVEELDQFDIQDADPLTNEQQDEFSAMSDDDLLNAIRS